MKPVKLFAAISVMLLSWTALAQDEHQKGYELYRAGKYKEAIVQLDEAIASRPNWFFPILLKGQCYLKLKEYKEAVRNIEDALTLEIPSKDIPAAKYAISQAYMGMEDYQKAIHAFNELIPLVPQGRHFEIYFNRGQAEMQIAKANEAKDRAKARDYYSKAIVSLSEALEKKAPREQLEQEASFQKAYAQFQIGNYEGSVKSLEKSIIAFEDVIVKNPKEQRAHTFLVNIGFDIAQKTPKSSNSDAYGKVVNYIDRYLKYWPNDADMMEKKGQALQGAKRYKEAIEVFKLVDKLKPNDGDVLFSLASCQMAANQYSEALRTFDKAVAKNPQNPAIYSYMAYSYQQQKNDCAKHDIPLYEKAVDILEKGVGKVSGQAKAELTQDLNRKRDNLKILQENISTDNSNHLAAIDNITKLSETIKANEKTLERNQELFIQQPTDELKSAIDEGKVAIRRDRENLEKEVGILAQYVEDVRKCGGADSYKHFTDMLSLLKQFRS